MWPPVSSLAFSKKVYYRYHLLLFPRAAHVKWMNEFLHAFIITDHIITHSRIYIFGVILRTQSSTDLSTTEKRDVETHKLLQRSLRISSLDSDHRRSWRCCRVPRSAPISDPWVPYSHWLYRREWRETLQKMPESVRLWTDTSTSPQHLPVWNLFIESTQLATLHAVNWHSEGSGFVSILWVFIADYSQIGQIFC